MEQANEELDEGAIEIRSLDVMRRTIPGVGRLKLERSTQLFGELGLTSMRFVTLMGVLAEEFGFALHRVDLDPSKLGTVGDLLDATARWRAEAQAELGAGRSI